MTSRDWDGFLEFLYGLPNTLAPGRQGVRVVRDNLQLLVEEFIMPHLSEGDHERLFPLGYSPSESDLKIVAGIGLERGLITSAQYGQALRDDKAAGPFGFLQTVSGKTFGESVAPMIARYWIEDEGDQYIKMSNRALYDFGWVPRETGETISVELKASSERNPRFQQIRHPYMTDPSASTPEYRMLLCLGLRNEGLEWWVFPAERVVEAIESGEFGPQHGGSKAASGTYWVTMDRSMRATFSEYFTDSETLREIILRIVATDQGREVR